MGKGPLNEIHRGAIHGYHYGRSQHCHNDQNSAQDAATAARGITRRKQWGELLLKLTYRHELIRNLLPLTVSDAYLVAM